MRTPEDPNYFNARSTNASAESLNSKMKAFMAQLRGVSDLPFFMYRMSTILRIIAHGRMQVSQL